LSITCWPAWHCVSGSAATSDGVAITAATARTAGSSFTRGDTGKAITRNRLDQQLDEHRLFGIGNPHIRRLGQIATFGRPGRTRTCDNAVMSGAF
jgi:hypothetical protein